MPNGDGSAKLEGIAACCAPSQVAVVWREILEFCGPPIITAASGGTDLQRGLW